MFVFCLDLCQRVKNLSLSDVAGHDTSKELALMSPAEVSDMLCLCLMKSMVGTYLTLQCWFGSLVAGTGVLQHLTNGPFCSY